MGHKKVKIHALTERAVAPYATIIGAGCVRDDGRGNCFGVLLSERSRGWRIGYLIVRERIIHGLERHPKSLETFEPVRGSRAVILFAKVRSPEKVKAFLLDRPLVVKKGVWHDVAVHSGIAEIKIFENIDVTTVRRELKKPIHF